jgi:hypothetical protein
MYNRILLNFRKQEILTDAILGATHLLALPPLNTVTTAIKFPHEFVRKQTFNPQQWSTSQRRKENGEPGVGEGWRITV